MELINFYDLLTKIPVSDWQRNWPADRTIMISMTSKRVKDVIDKMNLPLAVNLKRLLGKDNNIDTIISHSIFVMKSFTEFLSKLNNKYTIISFNMCNIQVIYPYHIQSVKLTLKSQMLTVQLLFFIMIKEIVKCSLYTITNIDISTVCHSVFGDNINKLYKEFKKCKKLTLVNFRGMQINFISSPRKLKKYDIDESDKNYRLTCYGYDKLMQIFCPSQIKLSIFDFEKMSL
jgi:hypothetical protein